MTNRDHEDVQLRGFNVEELRRVAECLRMLNPARCPNVDGTMRLIAAHSRAQLPDKQGYVETMGWCTTAYHDYEGRLLYKVTLSSFGVQQFVTKMGVLVNQAAMIAIDGAKADPDVKDFASFILKQAATSTGNKITHAELGKLFPNGFPLVVLKILAPEKSQDLTIEEVREVVTAISKVTSWGNSRNKDLEP